MKNATVTLKRSLIAVVIIAVLAALLLAACGGKEETPITVPEGAQAGDLVGLEPCTYEAKDVEYEADCGTLVVPENWDNPGSRLIALPVIRLNATGSNPTEPIFRFAGGPGESNMTFSIPEGLVENHDIVMVGYRGVDGSVELHCPEFAETMKGVGGDVSSKESIANMGDGLTRCAVRLQNEGFDLSNYTVPDVIEDMEAARKGLGYERVNLFSASYGCRVAMIYAWTYPESIHRSIMTAVNTPGRMVWEPDVIDEQIGYDAKLCAQDAGCSARTDDLAETMRNVAHDIPRRWLFLPIDPGKVRLSTHIMLFHRGSAAVVYNTYLAAEGGDSSGLWVMSFMFDLTLPAKAWGDHFAKGSIDFDPSRDYSAVFFPPDSILGTPMNLLWPAGQASEWPMPSYPAELTQVQPSDVETLLVSGSIDYSVPSRWATEALLPMLSNGQQVILSEFGHTGDFRKYQPEARIHMLTTFYDIGEVDDSLYTYQPMVFSIDNLMNDFPLFAKLIVAVIVLVIVLLVALVWFIARRGRVRRRRASQGA